MLYTALLAALTGFIWINLSHSFAGRVVSALITRTPCTQQLLSQFIDRPARAMTPFGGHEAR